jgi:hypothetical protein
MRHFGKIRKVKNIISLPALEANSHPGITALCETTVRLQADIQVYSVNRVIYYKYKVLQKNQATAFLTCEIVVVDTRTGVIPPASKVMRVKPVCKGQQNLTDAETRKRLKKQPY